MEINQNIPNGSKREEWIDISRFIAAVLVVFLHTFPFIYQSISSMFLFNGEVTFFLCISGYFIGKNNSWPKAIKRSVALLIPFLLWNIIASFFDPEVRNMNVSQYLAGLVGYHSLFVEGFNPLGIETLKQTPFIMPTWFLRDLILCSLISPLLMKVKWAGYILIILCTGTTLFPSYFNPASIIVMDLFTVAAFWVGLCLSQFDISSLKRSYQASYTPYVLLFTTVSLCLGIVHYLASSQVHPEWTGTQILSRYGVMSIQWPTINITFVSRLFGAFLLLLCGIIIERKFPMARKLSNYAPACFLIFVLHYPLMLFIPLEIWKSSPITPLFLIILIIASICGFYLFLRKFCPKLLPYLANDKVSRNQVR